MSETGARLVGEGGTLNRQARPRDRLHGARRRAQGKGKIHCKARGAAALCCCYERGVEMAGAHEMEERDRWWWCWREGGRRRRKKKQKERIGVLAFSALYWSYNRGKMQGSVCIFPSSCKKKKKKKKKSKPMSVP